MKITAAEEWLPVYEALASRVRLRMIELLSVKEHNVKELAESLGLSSAIMSMHVRKLEQAGLIVAEPRRSGGGNQKVCRLAVNRLEVAFPAGRGLERPFVEATVPVGHYTDFDIRPTCGLATTAKMIGQFDDPRYFYEPERVNAGILWFGQGFVEYKIPNYLLASQLPEELELSFELGSEAPGINEQWPSDITFSINGKEIGTWTSPGDFGGQRGACTPEWWPANINQYGFLKILRVTNEGTFLDGEELSKVKIAELEPGLKQWTLRFEVKPNARHVGGLTLFGRGFGNYGRDIGLKVFYRER
ncbi:helix-turn-helix domain-containing protein [Paenibacillus aurantius]|uniref:Helix-turn-helix domain-containing protein n=1 Tax=Paenibacillus aurantius TaxID=2918900 RepID=A0AA96LI19_9BACL|nr:ArsR family transcriptional regulator [Paenibacillus aurantius]WNQ12500.1 helix-turn-helix domain-containing protein [Paenibacillus aurantius]